jgi:hypothetical protein
MIRDDDIRYEQMLIEQMDYSLLFCWPPANFVYTKNGDLLLNKELMNQFLELGHAVPSGLLVGEVASQ